MGEEDSQEHHFKCDILQENIELSSPTIHCKYEDIFSDNLEELYKVIKTIQVFISVRERILERQSEPSI